MAAVAVLLTTRDMVITIAVMILFVAIAVVAALLATQVHPPRLVALLRRHLHSTAQLPVRVSIFLVVLLAYLALKLGLDVLLGAFAAGIVVRLFIAGEDSEPERARGHWLRVPHLDPLHRERDELRPQGADLATQGPASRTGVLRAVPPDARHVRRPALPQGALTSRALGPGVCCRPPGSR
jgi:hypothetical protein